VLEEHAAARIAKARIPDLTNASPSLVGAIAVTNAEFSTPTAIIARRSIRLALVACAALPRSGGLGRWWETLYCRKLWADSRWRTLRRWRAHYEK